MNIDTLCSNLVATGRYKAQVTNIKFKNVGAEANKDIAITLTIAEGKYAKKVLNDTIFEKAFGFRLKPFCAACGIDTARDYATADEMYKALFTEAKDKFVMIDVVIKPYNGKDYNNVDGYSATIESSTSADEVAASMGNSIDDMVEEETHTVESAGIPEAPAEAVESEEPSLDLSDLDSPF